MTRRNLLARLFGSLLAVVAAPFAAPRSRSLALTETRIKEARSPIVWELFIDGKKITFESVSEMYATVVFHERK